jgi:hypothetical protein
MFIHKLSSYLKLAKAVKHAKSNLRQGNVYNYWDFQVFSLQANDVIEPQNRPSQLPFWLLLTKNHILRRYTKSEILTLSSKEPK